MHWPKVSIIIPVFNTANYLHNCLNSIVSQTYQNLEILIIDDKSTDNSLKILMDFARIDERIKIIRHSTNKGLFHARITGVENATGDYICHIDSDDSVALDWIRLLTKEIVSNDADIVVGNTVNVDEIGWKSYYNNSLNFTRFKEPLFENEILDCFFEQCGSCYSWHTIWNKIYSTKIWKKSLPYLKKQDKHLIMTEDIAFSLVIFYFAKKMVFKNIDCYYYYKRETAATNINKSIDKAKKSIADVALVFDFLHNFFDSIKNGKRYLNSLQALKEKYYRIWCHSIINDFSNDKILEHLIKNLFNYDRLIDTSTHDFYFYQVSTSWNPNFENIKEVILDEKYEIISIDIFDTLIKRPFWAPSDLFIVMSKPAAEILKITNPSQFISMRTLSEELAREKALKSTPSREDVSLKEIYDCFSNIFNISKTMSYQLFELELKLEKKYCKRRESGVDLLEMAIFVGKKVVLTSDMYLHKDFVEQLLSDLGITGYSDLLISSDVGLLKRTGNLYKHLCKKYSVKPNVVLHIGDNWEIDITQAKKEGLSSLFLAKSNEIFANSICNLPTGKCLSPFQPKTNHSRRTNVAISDFSYRSILALVANKFFDFPNYSFQKESDFNGDPYFIGYYAIGFFMLGLSKWLQKELVTNGEEKIFFLARDGYLPQKAFNLLCNADKRYSHIISEYFFASRKSLMPYFMKSPLDFYSIDSFINLYTQTPISVLNLLSDVLLPLDDEILAKYKKSGIIMDKPFRNYNNFRKFIDNLLLYSYDKDFYFKKRQALKDYFKTSFSGKVAIFDLGYSGKLPKIINDLSENTTNSYFLHVAKGAQKIATDNNFTIKTFLDFTPAVSGIILEYLLSSLNGTCIGYSCESKEIKPTLNFSEICFEESYPIKTMQKGTIDFIKDFVDVFGDKIDQFNYNNSEIFEPLLYYLCKSKDFDTYMFNLTKLEDEIFSGNSKIPFLEIYNHYLTESGIVKKQSEQQPQTYHHNNVLTPLQDASKFKKALYYFIFDRKTFFLKIKQRCRKQ